MKKSCVVYLFIHFCQQAKLNLRLEEKEIEILEIKYRVRVKIACDTSKRKGGGEMKRRLNKSMKTKGEACLALQQPLRLGIVCVGDGGGRT